eukprot:669496-Prymnesium_polylepis.1
MRLRKCCVVGASCRFSLQTHANAIVRRLLKRRRARGTRWTGPFRSRTVYITSSPSALEPASTSA